MDTSRSSTIYKVELNMQKRTLAWIAGVPALFALLGCTNVPAANERVAHAMETRQDDQRQDRRPDVPYVPTPMPVVEEMLKLAKVTKNDVVYDLGCGDGRIVITAAERHGAKGIGVDIDPQRIRESNENAEKAGVTDLVTFHVRDLFTMDFRDASVVMLYLLPDINVKLRPMLFEQLRPGTRIVSHDFDMREWEPDQTVKVDAARTHTLYYWVIPANVEGTWTWNAPGARGQEAYSTEFRQEFQRVNGTARAGGRTYNVASPKLHGERITFTIERDQQGRRVTDHYEGKVDGDTIVGTVTSEGQKSDWRAQRRTN
jgi:SAM-dependent methyltransferase